MSFFKKLAKGEATWDDVKKGTREVGRAIDKHVIQPVVARPISRATKADIANAFGSLFGNSRFRRMPKPKVVQQVQKAAQKTADKVGQGAKNVAKQTGQAVTKAADKVGDVVRPAAQSVAKEVGHMVNPAIGEVALRGKQIAKASTPVLRRIGDKLGDAKQAVGDALLGGYTAVNPMRTGSQGFSLTGDVPTEQTKRSQFLPFFTKILPDAIGDTAKGVLRTGKGLLTADGGEIVSGLKRTGRGLGDTLKHTGLGTLEVLSGGLAKRPGDTIDGSGAGGQSGGSGVLALPPYPEDEEPTNSSNGTPVPGTPSKSQGPTDASGGGPIATALTSASPEQLYSDFYTQYRDIASPLQLITYQKAAESGDFKKMREIEAKLRGTA